MASNLAEFHTRSRSSHTPLSFIGPRREMAERIGIRQLQSISISKERELTERASVSLRQAPLCS